MEIKNEINNIEIEENNFFNNIIGKTINNAIDIGLKSILPDLIEEQVIDIKDALLQNGLKSGIECAIEAASELGKSTIGVFTGEFENIEQVKVAISDGGIIDTMSNILDKAINKTFELGYIDKSISTLIKNGKNVLLENISDNIKNKLDEQINIVAKLEIYVENWKEHYNNKDFDEMTKEYNKIKSEIDNVIPLENILKETREVEVLHNLIKNNGQNFEISNLEKELAGRLSN